MNGTAINYTLRKPIGSVACISPWNLPLYLFTWKIAPALASGNTVVAKPSEVTPMTAYLLSKICIEIGLPAGVLNIVHGQGQKTGAVLSEHKDIKAISFTGSTKVGAEIAKKAAPSFKKYSLEMGGKNPNIIFADCDYDKMLETTLRSSFANQGQICLCGSKIFIERSIYDKFKTDFVKKTLELKVGNPLDANTKVGAIVSFETEEEVMKMANDNEYGLAATIWTENLSRAKRMSNQIEAGIVWINTWLLRDLRTPFGGMKNSGVGREGGFEALRFFTEAKNVCIEYSK